MTEGMRQAEQPQPGNGQSADFHTVWTQLCTGQIKGISSTRLDGGGIAIVAMTDDKSGSAQK